MTVISRSHVLATTAAALLLSLTADSGRSLGADYPTKPVQIISTAAPGSAIDVIGRIVADTLGKVWSQQVIIINKPGGGGLIAAQSAARATPDGYTLLLAPASLFSVVPAMMEPMPIDLATQLTPIGLVGEIPLVIAVAPSLGVISLADLVAKGAATPEKLHFAANNVGSLPHLAGELLNSRSSAALNFVPYTGAGPALQDIGGGRLSIIIEGVAGISGALQSGTVKALAVTAPRRLANFPDLPTVAETFPGFAAVGWTALMAPTSVPAGIIQKINAELRKALETPELVKKLEALGTYVRPTTPSELAAFIKSEQAQWLPMVRKLGLKM